MTEVKYTGIGFCDVLGIVFIILKLCGILTWSWLWVLSPIWIPIAIAIICGIIFGLIGR